MFLWILSIYFGTLLGIFVSTVFLIVAGQNWGKLPRLYLRVVKAIQSYFPEVYPKDVAAWPSIIEKSESSALNRHKGSSNASFKFVDEAENPFDLCQDALISGVESIIQDGVFHAYETCPSYSESLVRYRPVNTWTTGQRVLFYATLVFRFLFLFPVRLALFTASFVWVVLAVVVSLFKEYTDVERTSVSVIYCRLYNASLGLVAKYHSDEHRPQKPGIAISNHMSPNDVQTLFAGVTHGSTFGYVVTGQKHTGLIGLIQRLAERVSPCMWLERKNGDERRNFQEDAIKIAKQSGPVLLFPEGYCSNNTVVFQFRKALFQDDVNIYPMAIKQNGQFGDGFWSEDEFYLHIFRLMISWAQVYEVTYLPKMHKMRHETAADFASRCQTAIADGAGLMASEFDGGLKYKKEEQMRLRDLQKKICADRLRDRYLGDSSDGSVSPTSERSEFTFSSSGYASFSESNHMPTELKCRKCSTEATCIFELPNVQEQTVQ